MIQGYERENDPEEVTSFCTMEAVVSIMTTDLWSVVDLTFEDDLVLESFRYFRSNFMQTHRGVYNLNVIST